MVIDFSKGVDYWVNIFRQLLDTLAGFLKECFGIDLFAADTEETTNG